MTTEQAPKVPHPPASLTVDPNRHIRVFSDPLWRVYSSEGDHPQNWDEMRHYGPIATMRFDPHPAPEGHHPDVSVMYTATRSHTALGEVFQQTRVIDRAHAGRAIVSWIPTRELQLLDLTSNWPVLNGAAASMQMDAKENTRSWARVINERFPMLDGLYHLSSINGEPLITLFRRAEGVATFPTRPSFHARLTEPAADIVISRATKELNYTSV